MVEPLPRDALPSVRFAGPAESNMIPDHLRVDGRVPSWDTATRKFTHLVEYFESEGTSHQAVSYDIFTQSWAGAAWSRLYEIDQRACEWAKQTVLLTFTGNYLLDSETDTFLPPVTFFARMEDAADARQKALSRALSDLDQWQSIRVIGPGPNGYPILQLGLYLSDSIQRDTIDSVIHAHINNCQIANSNAHHPREAISVRNGADGSQSPSAPSQLIHTLGRKVPGLRSGEGIISESWPRRATAAMLRGGQWRPYRFGKHS